MRKYIRLFLVIICCAVILASCADKMPIETTASEVTDSSETTKWIDTEMTRPPLYTQIRDTEPLKPELPELQEKIDRNQQYSSGVPSKVIIECGEQRDVPFLLLMCGRLANVLVDGYAISIYRPEQILRDSVYYPTYTITGDEDFMVYSNDAVQDDWRNSGITVVDLSEPEKTSGSYSSVSELHEKFAKGVYYAYVDVRCDGDDIMLDGRKIDQEYMSYRAYFILELV